MELFVFLHVTVSNKTILLFSYMVIEYSFMSGSYDAKVNLTSLQWNALLKLTSVMEKCNNINLTDEHSNTNGKTLLVMNKIDQIIKLQS